MCIHGWQDNAASFDALIPLLPEHISFLAIDLPGHGRSSRFPNGLVYSTVGDLYIINYIIRQFGWKHVSLMGHSLGAISCFIYAAIFPEMVDLVVALDGLYPRILKPFHVNYLKAGLESIRESDELNISGEEPKSYEFDELIEKMNSQTYLSVTRASAAYLLARGAKESSIEKDRYYFNRDARLKMFQLDFYTVEINENLAQSIDCPLLFVQALKSTFYTAEDQQDSVLQILMDKPDFEISTANGGHHVHINDAPAVSGAVSEFLLKHWPNLKTNLQLSKL